MYGSSEPKMPKVTIYYVSRCPVVTYLRPEVRHIISL